MTCSPTFTYLLTTFTYSLYFLTSAKRLRKASHKTTFIDTPALRRANGAWTQGCQHNTEESGYSRTALDDMPTCNIMFTFCRGLDDL